MTGEPDRTRPTSRAPPRDGPAAAHHIGGRHGSDHESGQSDRVRAGQAPGRQERGPALTSDVGLDPAGLLAAYDAELRTDAETPSARSVTLLGPLRLVTFAGGRGFVTYRDLGGADAAAIRALVAGALDHFRDDPVITRVEWKTRGHDHAPGLSAALEDHGFRPGDVESIMLGAARLLAGDRSLPDGVTLRQVTAEGDVRAMCRMQDLAFGDDSHEETAAALVARLARQDGMQLWVAEADGAMVCAGRLEPVAGSRFAGIWGGATLPAWRGRGIYRAVTAARARAAVDLGRTLVHSDSTAFSRPILERSGLVAVSTTTPYEWRRGSASRSTRLA